ncbi:hypothetical protein AVEN_87822-1 [Araneus ventricosus]|uniref:Uncharacterized protein n=1 Tax=Araneus ventricosus TaxID=182803 RepID=A0A4Y2BCJ5_ARAVE|nr:hypothetical protein AVEN_87822-1 [Araneus ventricosus]
MFSRWCDVEVGKMMAQLHEEYFGIDIVILNRDERERMTPEFAHTHTLSKLLHQTSGKTFDSRLIKCTNLGFSWNRASNRQPSITEVETLP